MSTNVETKNPNSAASPGLSRWSERLEKSASSVFIAPAILIVLILSIFPLLVSLYLSLSRFKFVRGGFEIDFVGFANYSKLLFGSEQRHFLGKMVNPPLSGWVVVALIVALVVFGLGRYLQSNTRSGSGVFWRLVAGLFLLAVVWLVAQTLHAEGLPGSLVVTLVFAFVGVSLQYLIGLGLAVLTTQNLPGRRFFRVIFLLPMMITPVGIGYMFRMLTDTGKGPFNPIWFALGLGDFSWVDTAWGARIAVIIGDVWQWTPFMFIVLLAALEAQSTEQKEAAVVDGATGWQTFRFVTFPQILPVSTTVILIRLIEAFK